jgi:hypothetical protein
MIGTSAEGTSVEVTPTDYEGVRLSELISVYKQAYLAEGFGVRKQVTRQKKEMGGRKTTTLVFRFPVAGISRKNDGVVSFQIVSAAANPTCAPCSVYPEVFGADGTEHSHESWIALLEKMTAADLRANAEIKRQLGKSVRSAEPNRPR